MLSYPPGDRSAARATAAPRAGVPRRRGSPRRRVGARDQVQRENARSSGSAPAFVSKYPPPRQRTSGSRRSSDTRAEGARGRHQWRPCASRRKECGLIASGATRFFRECGAGMVREFVDVDRQRAPSHEKELGPIASVSLERVTAIRPRSVMAQARLADHRARH